MLTWRRGVARVGWVLLAVWIVVYAAMVVGLRAGSPRPPPLDPTMTLQIFAGVASVPVAVFLMWRLLLWIGQGFWQNEAPAKPQPVEVHTSDKSAFFDNEKSWARLAFGAVGIGFVAYGIYLGRPPVFPGFSGMLIYLGVFASIAQLVEWAWSSVRTRRAN